MVGATIFLTTAVPVTLFHGLLIVGPALTIFDLTEKAFLMEARILVGTWVGMAIFLLGGGYLVWRHRVSLLRRRQLKGEGEVVTAM